MLILVYNHAYYMNQQDQITQIEVFTGPLWKASLLQQLLSEFDIYAVINNELTSQIDTAITGATGLNEVILIVAIKNYEEAVKLIEEYNNNNTINEEE